MTDKEKIVDKIRKLLALSESSNEHEAMLAMENANKLLMKHNLEMSDVNEVDINEMIEDDIMSGGRLMSYKTSLISSIMRLNNCEIVVHNRTRGQKIVKALGKKHNIQVSISMYEYLVSTMEKIIKKEKCGNANSFRIGFAHSINQKVNEIIKERNKKQNEFDEACTALVVVEKELVKKFMKEKYPNIRTTITKSSIVDHASYSAGRTAGQAVSLNSQIC
jgi:hypothetical protein